jgi:hypothetical protein
MVGGAIVWVMGLLSRSFVMRPFWSHRVPEQERC